MCPPRSAIAELCYTCRTRQGGRKRPICPSIHHTVELLRILRGAPDCMQPVAPRTSPGVGRTPEPRGGCGLGETCVASGGHMSVRLASRCCHMKALVDRTSRDSPVVYAAQTRVAKFHVQGAPVAIDCSDIVFVHHLRHI